MNRWKIPAALEAEVVQRDRACIYCGLAFRTEIRRHRASWEHIVNDARIVTRENIALCCIACNASKGAKLLSDWLESSYCKARGIVETVAPVAREALRQATKGRVSLKISYSATAKRASE